MEIRNSLYDKGIKPSASFDLPVIGIGNLTVGGTGKSPMVEYMIRLLSPTYKLATVSRGYGRETKGYRQASQSDNADTIGDEPFQFFRKFGEHVVVSVGEERALAIPLVLQENPDVQVILLDDAFQHRQVTASLNILLCDYSRPFYEDLVLPAGLLRESKHSAVRADIIVVTKCPAVITDDTLMDIERAIREIATKPIFFSTISYSLPVPFENTSVPFTDTVILVTGIANTQALVQHAESKYKVVKHISFRDHHRYSETDLNTILEEVRRFPGASVLTTEKDMVKLEAKPFLSMLKQIPFYYLPISVQFLKEEREFDEIVTSHVRKRSLEKLRS